MTKTVKNSIRKEYDRLKKVFEKLLKPKNEQTMPQLVLQPVRNKRY